LLLTQNNTLWHFGPEVAVAAGLPLSALLCNVCPIESSVFRKNQFLTCPYITVRGVVSTAGKR
jgi:hypothetical protein